MMITKASVLRVLSDGQFHSGEELGALLGVSRAAVWKQLQSFEAYGLQVESVRGRGYRVDGGFDLLDHATIMSHLNAANAQRLQLDVQMSIASTNEYLMSRQVQASEFHACIAEHQSQGRGRRGRQWISPFGASLYLSIRRRFESGVSALDGLSLAVGIVLAQALQQFGYAGVKLKWPNDLLVGNSKLGGILIEISGDAAGAVDVVIGVGINVRMPAAPAESIDQPWVDLHSVNAAIAIDRNRLAALILDALVELLAVYERNGFHRYRDAWSQFDACVGRLVTLRIGQSVEEGIAAGVDSQGALLLETVAGIKAFSGGEISLRIS